MTMPLASIKTPSPMEMDDEKNDNGGNDLVIVSPTFCAAAAAAAEASSSASAATTPRVTWGGAAAAATADSLPSDVLWRIATMLPSSDLPSAMAVCSSWRRGFGHAIDALCPGSLSVTSPAVPPQTQVPGALYLAQRFPYLRSLDLSSVPASSATDAALVEPLRALVLLERLSLRGCRALTSAGLSRALVGTPRLRWLDLSGCVGLQYPGGSGVGSGSGSGSGVGSGGGGLSAALPPGSLARLEAFRAERIPWLRDGDVVALAAAVFSRLGPSGSSSPPPPRRRGLVELSLDGAGRLTGEGISSLAPPPPVARPTTRSSPSLPHRLLERLSLAGCPALEDGGLAVGLAPFARSLESLVVDRCPLVGGKGLATGSGPPSPDAAASVSAPPVFAALKHLSARDSGIDDEGVEAAFSSIPAAAAADAADGARTTTNVTRFPALEELVLDDCSSLTDRGIAALAGGTPETQTTAGVAAPTASFPAGLPRLASLSLSRLPGIGGSGLDVLLPACPGLKSLCLAGCVRLGEEAALAIADTASIESLDVSDCERVSSGFLSILGGSTSLSLRRLDASRCPRLGPASLRALGGGGRGRREGEREGAAGEEERGERDPMPRALEELAVSGCGALFAAAAVASATGGGGGGATRRWDSGADAIASSLPNLRSLDVSATALDEAGLRELLLPPERAGGGRGEAVAVPLRPRLPLLATLNVACCPGLSRAAVDRAMSSLLLEHGSSCRVNSWGCRRGSTTGGESEEKEQGKERAAGTTAATRKADAASTSPSAPAFSGPVLSFGHLSPPRGNKAAAAVLAAAA